MMMVSPRMARVTNLMPKHQPKGGLMERIDLVKTIQESTATFCQNRIGDKPPISVTVSPTVTDIPWPDRKLQELVKLFLYETLLTNDPDAEVAVSLRRRSMLKGLGEFVGVQPSYWLHLRTQVAV
jgi:hypothetical protein